MGAVTMGSSTARGARRSILLALVSETYLPGTSVNRWLP